MVKRGKYLNKPLGCCQVVCILQWTLDNEWSYKKFSYEEAKHIYNVSTWVTEMCFCIQSTTKCEIVPTLYSLIFT